MGENKFIDVHDYTFIHASAEKLIWYFFNNHRTWFFKYLLILFILKTSLGTDISECVNGAKSDYFHLENGVPMGSVLSVSINRITANVLCPVHCSLFLDDFAIYVPT